MPGPAGPDERDDDKQQARRRDDLAEQDRRAATMMLRGTKDGLAEHGISQRSPADGPGDLAGHDGGSLGQAVVERGYGGPGSSPLR